MMIRTEELNLVTEWDKTFPKSEKVEHSKVTFANRYGINLTAVRSYAHRHKIPTKREYGQTYYSQKHFDELRRTDIISDDRYYTSSQAAEKYGLNKANIVEIVKRHQIAKVKVGRNNLLLIGCNNILKSQNLWLKSSYSAIIHELPQIIIGTGASFSFFAPEMWQQPSVIMKVKL